MIDILSNQYCRLDIPADRPVELDLGCGKGGFLLQLAQRYPERQILGADVMMGRLRKVESKCRREGCDNVRLLRVSAWPLVAALLPGRCLDRVHILCPDPWPKARHRGNRLLGSEFLGTLAGRIKAGGSLHVSTDNRAYLAFILESIAPLSPYCRDDDAIADVRDLKTDFELGFEADGRSVTHCAWRVE